MKTIEHKSERIATRVTPSQKELIARAASLRGRSLTDFIIDSAQKEAANTIEEAVDAAKELGGNDFISGNYYRSVGEGLLKPCEMPAEKVIDFVECAEVSLLQ